MKKTFIAKLAFALLGIAALSSCHKSKTEEPSVLMFKLEVTDITSTSAHTAVTPTSDDATYYFDVLGKEGFDAIQADLQSYLDGEVKRRAEAYSLTEAEVLEKLLSKGPQTYDFKSLSPLSDYYLIAFAANTQGEVTGGLSYMDFSTEAVNPSTNTLDITIGDIFADGADYTVTPSVEEDSYAVDIWSKSMVDALGDGGTISYFLEYNSYLMFSLTTSGKFDFVNETDGKVWQPGRDYYVVAFGYDQNSGQATTKLFKKEFRTEGGDPATCTFTFSVTQENSIVNVKVVPSDKKVVYIWNIMDMTTFDKYKETYKTDESTLAYILNGGIEELMTNDMCKRQLAVEALGRWSGYTSSDEEGADNENFKGLTQGETFIAWAVAVDADGVPEGQFYTSKFVVE